MVLVSCKTNNTPENTNTPTSQPTIQNNSVNNNLDDNSSDKNKPNNKPNTNSSSPSSVSEKLPDYSSIACRKIGNTEWQSVRIKIAEIKRVIQIDIPTDWTLKKSNGSITISRKGKKIGLITTKEFSEPIDYFKPNGVSHDIREINVDWQINLLNDSGYKFYHYMEIISGWDNVTSPVRIQINYEELDAKSIEVLANSILTIPADKLELSYKTSNKILILGNSFIYTSQIGSFLSDFIDTAKKDYIVDAISIGNASVTTFSQNQSILEDISNGEYAYVFQCGFYSTNDLSDFTIIKTACDISNTPIFILPAHNEHSGTLLTVKNKLCTIPILNWKAEVDKLILAGVNYYDFCIDDGPQHSKPLAGYVGAYTIFFNLFKETPPSLSSYAPLSMSYVNSMLGNNISKIGYEGENLLRIKSPKKLLGTTYSLD